MLDSIALDIISAYLNETFANGKFKLKEADRELVTLFIGFKPETDTLDTKAYTRLNKLLGIGIKRGTQLTGLDILTKVEIKAMDRGETIHLIGYDDLSSFGANAYAHLKPAKYTQYVFDKASPAELTAVDALRKRLDEVQPIIAKFKAMKDRVTRNGKLSKAIEKKNELQLIQFGLSPALKEAMLQIKGRWEKVMTANFLRYYKNMLDNSVEFISKYSATPDRERQVDDINRIYTLESKGIAIRLKTELYTDKKFRPASEDEILVLAERDAKDEADSFFDKLLFKLNGVFSDKHPFTGATEHWNERTPFESNFNLQFENGFSFTLHSQIIVNFSVYGKPFHQFPTVFRNIQLNDQNHPVLSELQLKVLLTPKKPETAA
jgi:hypothetical protein